MQAYRALASSVIVLGSISFNVLQGAPPAKPADKQADHHHAHIHFDVKSVADGNWSDAKTWAPPRVPKAGDRVLVSRENRVTIALPIDGKLSAQATDATGNVEQTAHMLTLDAAGR